MGMTEPTADDPPARSHRERRAAAAESFIRFVPEAEPERVARSFERRLGPLGTFAFETVGAMWDREVLSRRDRSLFIISTLAAQARDEELVGHTQIGLRHGLTRSEIEEILPMVAAYAGFPAAMAAARHIDEGLRQAEGVDRLTPRMGAAAKDDHERDAAASDVLTGLTREGDATIGAIEATTRLGHLGEVASRWVLGEVWARAELSARDRSIVAISILVALGAERALRFHVRGGLHSGLSSAEIEEIISHLGLYVGVPRAVDAMLGVREILDEAE
jgi:4-carboxymuconolactone decarboxylase